MADQHIMLMDGSNTNLYGSGSFNGTSFDCAGGQSQLFATSDGPEDGKVRVRYSFDGIGGTARDTGLAIYSAQESNFLPNGSQGNVNDEAYIIQIGLSTAGSLIGLRRRDLGNATPQDVKVDLAGMPAYTNDDIIEVALWKDGNGDVQCRVYLNGGIVFFATDPSASALDLSGTKFALLTTAPSGVDLKSYRFDQIKYGFFDTFEEDNADGRWNVERDVTFDTVGEWALIAAAAGNNRGNIWRAVGVEDDWTWINIKYKFFVPQVTIPAFWQFANGLSFDDPPVGDMVQGSPDQADNYYYEYIADGGNNEQHYYRQAPGAQVLLVSDNPILPAGMNEITIELTYIKRAGDIKISRQWDSVIAGVATDSGANRHTGKAFVGSGNNSFFENANKATQLREVEMTTDGTFNEGASGRTSNIHWHCPPKSRRQTERRVTRHRGRACR